MNKPETSARYWIDRLQLAPHPEGGYFRQTYAAGLTLSPSSLPSGFTGPRSSSTAIYFLLESGNFSAFHRIRSDEMWHFYTGDPLEVFVLQNGGLAEKIVMGGGIDERQNLQALVPAGRWFASRLVSGGSFALAGCTVSPGFHFEDFELAVKDELIASFPRQRELIEELTRS